MPSEELLGSRDDVPDDDGRAQREHDMFVVRVQNQAIDDLTYKSVSGEPTGDAPTTERGLPLNPMTACSSSSFSIFLFLLLQIFK